MTTVHAPGQIRSRPGQPSPRGRRDPAVPRQEFTGTFPAVLIFSILLAALCLFSIPRFVPVRGGR
jgi:hypothetical protein